eukprot:TRINITY_DN1991_c0_g1_i1.p1 TRINITY_DN1991_c0_g1~~TRINITY_DN1991_c0_g1_i1.p1  ORF type:complete len:138 (-),score=27.61 TRINITY_DN1991_c0_g1_i1:194-607(-)
MFYQVLVCVLVAGSSMGAPSTQGSHTRAKRQAPSTCENHPCGWIKYHDSNWNSYSAYDVIENTFCPCPSIKRCRYFDTDTALDLHRFTCQAEDGTNRSFPTTNSRRRRRSVRNLRNFLNVLESMDSPRVNFQDVQFS